MSIQLVLMKSGEDVIADVYEMRDDEGRPQAFILRDPQIVRIKPNLEKPEEGPNCTFENWVPLSPNNRFLIKEGAFLTITDPLEPLKAHFIERFGEDDGELTDSAAEERQGDPDATGGDVG